MGTNGTSLIGKDSRKNRYYQEINSELLTPQKAIKKINHQRFALITDEYAIHPYRGSMNKFAVKALTTLANKLKSIGDGFSPEDIANQELDVFLEKFQAKDLVNQLEKRLRKDYTAVIIPVTNKINALNLDHTTRMILSNESIYQYLLYKVIAGFGVNKTEGILSSLMDSINKIQQYINKKIAYAIIEDQNLEYTPDDLKLIKEKVGMIPLAYDETDLNSTVVEIYNEIKSSGGLVNHVNQFLDSGVVEIPFGTNRQTLITRMVAYLSKVGYQIPAAAKVEAPLLRSPAEGEIFTDQNINFSWSEIEDAVSYQVQIAKTDNWDKENGFGRVNLVNEFSAFGASLLWKDTSIGSGKYFWTVRAILGSGEKTEFAVVRSFELNLTTTQPPNPIELPSPALVHPDDNETVALTPIELQWSETQDSIYYNLQISTKNDFQKDHGFDPDDIVENKNVKAAKHYVNDLPESGKYYWTVKVIHRDNRVSDFANPLSFTFEKNNESGSTSSGTHPKKTLEGIHGIGPATESFLEINGIETLVDLMDLPSGELENLISTAPGNIKNLDTSTWIKQAQLLEEEKFDEFHELVNKLKKKN